MSPNSTVLTVKAQNGSPYQLNHEQVRSPSLTPRFDTHNPADSQSLESSFNAHQII
jgi:hypothetical protein